MSKKLADQTQNAFDFVQKLYFETSYLIKEVEGQLGQEEESFQILRPSGYAVTTSTSTGLEPVYVDKWLPKTFTVLFCPEGFTEIVKGQTITPFRESLKLLLLHIELLGRNLDAPRVISGYIKNIKNKAPKRYVKFEHLMWEFASSNQKMFANVPIISFDDTRLSFEGHCITEPLFSINSSDDVKKKLIDPVLELYRLNK